MENRTRAQKVRQLEDSIKRLKDTSDQQSIKLKELSYLMTAMNLKIDQLREKSLAPAVSMEASSLIPTKPRIGSAFCMNHTQTKIFKLYFPTFEGDPTGRVYKCERFFKYNEGLEDEKIIQ